MISEKAAFLIGCSISTELSEPQKYGFITQNPILGCLLDQCQRDPELKGKFSNQQSLLDGIIKALEDGSVAWPGKSNQVTREKWIEKMKIDMTFWFHFSRNAKEMEDYENFFLEADKHVQQRHSTSDAAIAHAAAADAGPSTAAADAAVRGCAGWPTDAASAGAGADAPAPIHARGS